MRNWTTATAAVTVTVTVALVGCGTPISQTPDRPSVSTSATNGTTSSGPAEASAADVAAAERTVRDFFAVTSSAEEPYSAKIDRQERYLTSRDVHPSTAYEKQMGDGPVGVTEDEVRVELTDTRPVDEGVRVDFATETVGRSYRFVGKRMSKDHSPMTATWDGSATLVKVNGSWLIDELTITAYGGGIG